MEKFITPKIEKAISKTYPILSKTKGWNMKTVEISNNAYIVEAVDSYGRIISKQGVDPTKVQDEIEELITCIKISK